MRQTFMRVALLMMPALSLSSTLLADTTDDSWSCQAFCQYYPNPGPGPVLIPYPRPYATVAVASDGRTAAEAYNGLSTQCAEIVKAHGDPSAPQYAVVDRNGNEPSLREVCVRN